MVSNTEEKFHAAVNVIRGLPKNGSYQPSNDLMLSFYSYFKQATEGACRGKRPAFWDVVNRAKYDAWKKLGNMSREDAMNNYVEELKKIIETMSYTENVSNFMGSISELDGVSVTDLEAVAPDAIKKVRSQPNSPFASREASPERPAAAEASYHNGYYQNGHHYEGNGHLIEQSDDEYIDTIAGDEDGDALSNSHQHHHQLASHSSRSKMRHNKMVHGNNETTTVAAATAAAAALLEPIPSFEVDLRFHNVLTALNATVEQMHLDLERVTNQVRVLEHFLSEVKNSQGDGGKGKVAKGHANAWWPLRELTPATVLFIVVWPIVVAKVMAWNVNRRSH